MIGNTEGVSKRGQERHSAPLRCLSLLPCGPWLDLHTECRSVSICVFVCVLQMRQSMKTQSQRRQVRE